MRVDGREIPVTGSLLPPLHRRTSDIMRVAIAAVLLGGVIAGSLITRSQWDALETSVSNIVGVLSPSLSDTVYLLYGIAILALPFAILIGLIVGRRWKLLAGYAASRPVRRCRAVLHRNRPGGTEMAPRRAGPTRRHLPVSIPRRSAMDRDARGGAHRLGPVASEEVATSLVDAASALRSHPSDRQLDRSRTIDAGSRRRLPDRRGDRSRRRHPCPRSAVGLGSTRTRAARLPRHRVPRRESLGNRASCHVRSHRPSTGRRTFRRTRRRVVRTEPAKQRSNSTDVPLDLVPEP